MSEQPRDAAPNVQDVAPGVTDAEEFTIRGGIQSYVIGLVLATLLTAVSFYVAKSNQFWQPSIPIALVVLAIAQIAVHLIFFIHITTAPDNTNNILALAFGVLIVTLIVAGSLWIMYNLNHNLMPMNQIMHMQR
jgi:cytochrome o ubiquinol oxidase subunit IV